MLSLSSFGMKTFICYNKGTLDFFNKFAYTIGDMGGVNMNEFEKDIQSKTNDVVDNIKGFTFSFVFFLLIFAIGVTISVLGS